MKAYCDQASWALSLSWYFETKYDEQQMILKVKLHTHPG